jgi:serine/threonine protein kinase
VTSERIQRRIERLLDQAETAADERHWQDVQSLAREVLSLDESNADAEALLQSATRMLGVQTTDDLSTPPDVTPHPVPATSAQPTSFAAGRYQVLRFLGEGSKKKVYLAHDTRLDRDVAFALIKTEGLDAAARERITPVTP